MKKVISLLIAFLAFFLFSCSNNIEIVPENDPNPEQFTTTVSYEEALQALDDVLSLIDAPETRGVSSKRTVANYYTVGEPI